jgi:hypothetical protein
MYTSFVLVMQQLYFVIFCDLELPSLKGTSQNLLTSLQFHFLRLIKEESENTMQITKYNTDRNKIIITHT